MKKALGFLVVVGVLASGTAFAADAAKPAEPAKVAAPTKAAAPAKGGKPTIMYAPVADYAWIPLGEPGKSPSVSFTSGDMKTKGAWTGFIKMPAGFDSGWHTHNSDYDGVVVQGTVTNPVQGETNNPTLTAGSSWFQPGKQNHKTVCGAEGDCLISIHSKGGFSFNVMTEDGKPVPAAKPAEPAKKGT